MKHATPEALCRRCALGACLAISACSTAPPAAIEPPAPVAAKAWARLAQRGHGTQTVFALCRGDSCPRPTPKTLNTAPRAIAPTVPGPTSVAPIPLLDSTGSGEQVEMQVDPAAPAAEKSPDARTPPAPP
jgi:hypothetical protein